MIYADFEAVVAHNNTPSPDDRKSYTQEYQKHVDCGFAYKVVCCVDGSFSKPVKVYRGEKAVYKCMKRMLKEVAYCQSVKEKFFNKDMTMTKAEIGEHEKSAECHICDKSYVDSDIRVRDHCHITGKYRGSAHSKCNMIYRMTDKIPVIFHNLRGYDSHFIMQEIGKFGMDINVIPNNMEKYMSFMLGRHLVFIDSFQFMSSALGRLVDNLPKDRFTLTSEEFKGGEFDLMTRKGVYPYDYMSSFEKFKDTCLPTKDEFYSILNNEHISDDDYAHAHKVWRTFRLGNMGEYHDLYMKSDVLLLADVFENFRKTCLQYYKLDPCHYFSSPGLSWDAMLKMTGVKIELMTDINMFQFIEKGLRGGTSYIANRYGVANNKYMKKYDEKLPSKYLMYLDANLYGWAMSQYLPTGGFKWFDDDKVDLSKYGDESDRGLILEVDLEYPDELHEKHNDFPLAPKSLKLNRICCQTIAIT